MGDVGSKEYPSHEIEELKRRVGDLSGALTCILAILLLMLLSDIYWSLIHPQWPAPSTAFLLPIIMLFLFAACQLWSGPDSSQRQQEESHNG